MQYRRAAALLASLRQGAGAATFKQAAWVSAGLSAAPVAMHSLPLHTAASAAPHWRGQQGSPAGPAAAAAARSFADEADSTLAPCERPAVAQQSNDMDAQLAAAASDGPFAVLALVYLHAEQFTEQNVVSALKAVATCYSGSGGGGSSSLPSPTEVVKTDGYQALVDMTLAGMQRFPNPLLAEAVYACGVAGASEEMLLDEVGRHIMAHIPDLAPADIANLACGFAALDHSPGITLFESMAGRAADLQQQFSAEQRQAVREAYEALGYAAKLPTSF